MSQPEEVPQKQLYMYQAGYTAEAVAAQIAKPQDRTEAIKAAFEAIDAKIVGFGYTFGEHDVVVVYEAPDDITAAAVALAIAAGGAVRSAKTTRLMSGQEWIKSLGLAQKSKKTPRNTRSSGSGGEGKT